MIAPVSCVQCAEPLSQSPNNGFLHDDVCALAWITANPAPKRTPVQPTEPVAPEWDAKAEAMLHLNDIEAMQGGRNGPTIKLRAAIEALYAHPPVQPTEPVAYEGPDGHLTTYRTPGYRALVYATDTPVQPTVTND